MITEWGNVYLGGKYWQYLVVHVCIIMTHVFIIIHTSTVLMYMYVHVHCICVHMCIHVHCAVSCISNTNVGTSYISTQQSHRLYMYIQHLAVVCDGSCS